MAGNGANVGPRACQLFSSWHSRPAYQRLELPIGVDTLAGAPLVCNSIVELELRFKCTRMLPCYAVATQGQGQSIQLIVKLDGATSMREFAIRILGSGWDVRRWLCTCMDAARWSPLASSAMGRWMDA